jgi:membrane-associated phospholipid phosphatase
VPDRSRLGWTAAAVSTCLGVALTLAVRSDGPLPGEVGLARWAHDHTPGLLDPVAGLLDALLTDLAAPAVFALLVALAWWSWGRYPAAVLALAGAATGLTRIADLVERPRPTPTLRWSGYSFGSGGYPSGHAVFVVLVFGTLALLARRHIPGPTGRRMAAALWTLVALACWLRVSRLEHWPADVLGGVLLALPALLAVVWLEARCARWLAGSRRLSRLLGI